MKEPELSEGDFASCGTPGTESKWSGCLCPPSKGRDSAEKKRALPGTERADVRNLAEANLLALIESTEDPIWSVDLEYRLIAFNGAFLRHFETTFGVRPRAGMLPADLAPTERAEFLPPLYRRALTQGPFRTEFSLADGRVLDLSLNPIFVDGQATGISVIGKDITARKASEAALLEAEKRYHEIFSGALEGMFRSTPEGNLRAANPALARMLGYNSVEEVIGEVQDSAHDVWGDPGERARYLSLLEQNPVLLGFECQYKRKDGSKIWVSLNVRKVCAHDGRVLYLEGFIQDITARKEAVEALTEREARFRRFFYENGCAMLLVDPASGAIVAANDAAASFHSLRREDLIGRLTGEMSTLGPEQSALDRQMALNNRRSVFKYRIRLASGEERAVEAYTSPLNWIGRQVLFCIVHDITERLRTEEALRESLDSLKEAQTVGALGSYVLDVRTGVWTSSDLLNELFGIDGSYPMTVEGWTELIHPGDRATMASYFAQEVVGERKTFDKEYRIIRQADQTERWVHGRGKLDFDALGQPVKMRGVIRDITERKQAELKLRASEERYRATFEQAPIGITHTSFDGRFLRCNPRFAEIAGYTREEIKGMSFRQITAPEDQADIEAVREQVGGDADANSAWEKRCVRKDGSLTWVKVTVSTQRDAEGQPLYLIALVEDINARKEAEQRLAATTEALRLSEAHYRTVFQTSVDGICISQLSDGRYIDANRAFLDLFGYEREELIGRTSLELNFWTAPEIRPQIAESLGRGESTRDVETQFRKKNGEEAWILFSAAPVEIEGVPCVMSIVRDISAAKAAEERLAAAQQAQQASEARYQAAFETTSDTVTISRLNDGVYIECNQAFLDVMGYEREEVVGRTSRELNIWTDRSDRDLLAEELRKHAHCRELVARFRKKNGEIVWGQMSASIMAVNGVDCMLCIARDISAAKAAEERLAAAQRALQASETRYRTAFQTSIDAININRLSDGCYVDCNQAFLNIVGYERNEVIGRTSLELNIWANPRDRKNLVEILRQHRNCRDLEAQFRKKNGEVFWGQMSASVIEIDGVPCILSITRDISGAKVAEDEIRSLAFYDPLTRLPNRRLVSERLRQTLAGSARSNRKGALLFIDLDDFKMLNDTLGHKTGDLLLQEVARRLTGAVRDADTVARLGGDEFVVILEDLSGSQEEAAAQAKTVAEKILAAVSQPYLLAGRECLSTSSVGITLFGERTDTIDDVLQQADIAMYQAKTVGRNTLRFFAPALQSAINARASMEEDLRQGIGTDQFELYYQPQVAAGTLIGAEALLRWKHPSRGFLPPGEFIPLAEQTGQILPLGDWVLETACRQIAAWAQWKETAHLTIAVNISARQLRHPDFVDQVLSVLYRTGANPRNLDLELTESMLVENVEEVIAKMSALKAHGLRFSLDDFGTGYSSLAYLKRLPLDQLKIDRAFVHDMLVDVTSGAIAQTIISLGRAMGLSVIAEGVETEEQREFLAAMDCHAFQGFLFSRPLPLHDFQLLLPDIEEDIVNTV